MDSEGQHEKSPSEEDQEEEEEEDTIPSSEPISPRQGCQMAKFDPFLSLDWARVEGVGAQSKERKGSNMYCSVA